MVGVKVMKIVSLQKRNAKKFARYVQKFNFQNLQSDLTTRPLLDRKVPYNEWSLNWRYRLGSLPPLPPPKQWPTKLKKTSIK